MKKENHNTFLKKEIFHTEDFYLTAFLITNDLQLINIDRTNPRRCQFIFSDNSKREKLVQSYNFAISGSKDILVDARKFTNAIKDLKTKLYSGQ